MLLVGRSATARTMGKVEKISVALTPELASTVREAVASGDYASTSEVMRDALRGWREVRAEREQATATLRSLIQEGLRSGEAADLNMEEIKRSGREALAARRA